MSNGSGITPVGSGAGKPGGGGQVLQIQSLPDALKTVGRTLHLEGEVVGQNKDGSTRIRTAEGNIDITFRGRQPQPGARIEVEIPPGNPPRQVTVRTPPAPAQTPQQPPAQTGQPAQPAPTPLPATPVTQPSAGQTPAPQPGNGTAPPAAPAQSAPVTSQPDAPSSPAPATGTAVQSSGAGQTAKPVTPLPASYQPAPGTAFAPGAPPPVLMAGQLVRLAPIAPALAQSLIQQSATAQPSLMASLTQTMLQSDLTTRGGMDGVTPSIIQTIKSLNAQTPPQTQNPLLNTPENSPQITSPQLPQAAGTATAKPDTGITAVLSPMTESPGNGDSFLKETIALPKIMQIDAKILDIKPPAVQFTQIMSQGTESEKLQALLKPETLLASSQKPGTITGIVTGFTAQKMPMITIQWPGGGLSQNFAMQFPAANLEVGSRILFEPQTQAPAQPGTGTPIARPILPMPPLMEASSLWPAADDLFQALLQNSPAAAQALGKIIPTPSNPAQMGAAALLFVASVRSGDIANWLGEKKLEAIAKLGKTGFVSRLAQDAGAIATANADAPSSDWRSYPIPMLWQNEIAKVMLHVKHENEHAGSEEKGGTTRFVFDLSLNRMGEVQLDGFLQGKRLDLIVRTQLPISYPMQEAMKTAYATALEGTDIFGELGFQGDMKNWMQVVSREDKLGLSA